MPINWYQTRQILGPNATLAEKKLAKIHLRIEKLALKGKSAYLEYSNLVDELVEKGDYSAWEQSLYYYYGIDIIDAVTIDSVKKSSWDEICYQTGTPFLKKLKKVYDQKNVYQVSYDIFSSDVNNINVSLSEPLVYDPTEDRYLETGITQSFFNIYRVNDVLYMNVNDLSLHSVDINRATWDLQYGYKITYTEDFQQFFLGTFSGFKDPSQPFTIDVPTTVMREYLISVEYRESDTSWSNFHYRLNITRNNFLGKIREVDIYTPDAKYLLLNNDYAKIIGARKSYLEVYKIDTTSPTGFQVMPSIFAYDNLAYTEDQNLLTRYSQAIDYLNS